MYITLTMKINNKSYDINIDAGQKISAAFKVLCDAGYVKGGQMPNWYRSGMRGCLVSAYRTFEEEQIFGGDILTAIDKKER
ncbi:MAG: hypothetical protein PUF12_01550 [Thermoflexaceae bacterium]|nr:hypothetical protein [Thermoflexaceae bacterium]